MMAAGGMKLRILCLAVLIIGACGRRPSRSINGRDSALVPYQVSIQTNRGDHHCGGAVLDGIHIVTAAHCIVTRNRLPYSVVLEVVVGVVNKTKRNQDNVFQIVKKTIHENYDPASYKNDIAVLKLDRNITLSYVRAIQLPIRDTGVGTQVMLTGWGATEYNEIYSTADGFPELLRFYYGHTMSRELCQMMMVNEHIHDENLCVWGGGRSISCRGDSGSPLSDGNYLVGINSYNLNCNSNYPDVYTRVYKYLEWIRDAMSD